MTRGRRAALVAAWLVFFLAVRAPASEPPLGGLSLEAALESLERDGLRLIYSSQVVTPDMRVLREPVSTEPTVRLRELLAPHGLGAVPLAAGGYAIVRDPAPTAPQTAETVPDSPGPAAVEEVVVHASRYEFMRDGPARGTELPRHLFEVVPGVSEDAARILQRLPGTAANGVSARTHVRGSYDDELLVEFDGVRLYNPYHLKDFQALFGLLDPELIESAEYFSGGFPARYGGRAGGVLDIGPRVPEQTQTLLGLSTLNSRIITSGRAFDGRGEWLAGYRRSNLNAILRFLDRDVGEPEFEDFALRYRHELTPAMTATLGVLGLDDRLDLNSEDGLESASASYRDRYVWAAVEHRLPNGLTGTLRLSDASLSSRRGGAVLRPGTSRGALADARRSDIDTVAVEIDAPTWRDTRVSIGVEASDVSASYDYVSRATYEGPLADAFGRGPFEERSLRAAPDGWSYAAHAALHIGSGPWASELGLRWERATYGGLGTELSPRLSVRRQLDEGSALRLTLGRYLQTQSIGELDVEQAVPEFVEAESAWHAILGYEVELLTGPELRIEAFGKRMDDVRPRWENVLDPLVLLPELEVDRLQVDSERSTAYGVELSLSAAAGATPAWWFSYTWSQTRDEIEGQTVVRSWDQRHAAAAGATWSHERWQFTVAVNWHAGWPMTPLSFDPPRFADEPATVTLEARNSARQPDYFSLDVRANYSLPLPIGILELRAEILNLTNRNNPCCREVGIGTADASDFTVDQKGWLGIAPIVGVNWRF